MEATKAQNWAVEPQEKKIIEHVLEIVVEYVRNGMLGG
jgi:hypothetical protein